MSIADKICESAKKIADLLYDEDFTHGYSYINPAINHGEKKFACSTFVG